MRAFDNEIRRFLKTHARRDRRRPRRRARDAVLARGQRPRPLDHGRPAGVRRAAPAASCRAREAIAASALDTAAWAGTAPDLITAQGLLMYLSRDEVHGLFEAMPPRDGASSTSSQRLAGQAPARKRDAYEAPPWTCGADAQELAALPVRELRRVPFPHGGRCRRRPARLTRIVRAIDVYSARTIAASSSITTTPATTSTAASATNAASAARDATRATRRDA